MIYIWELYFGYCYKKLGHKKSKNWGTFDFCWIQEKYVFCQLHRSASAILVLLYETQLHHLPRGFSCFVSEKYGGGAISYCQPYGQHLAKMSYFCSLRPHSLFKWFNITNAVLEISNCPLTRHRLNAGDYVRLCAI